MSIRPHFFLSWRWWDNHNVYVNLATLHPFVEMMRQPQWLCQYGHTPSFCGDDETTTMFMSIWPHFFLLWRWWDNHNVYVNLATLLPFVEMMRLPQCLCQYGHTPSFCGDDETTTMFMSIWPHSFLLWRWWDNHNVYVNLATLLPFVEMMRLPQWLCQYGHTPSFCGDDETTTMFMSIWPHSFLLWRWWDNHNVYVNMATLLPFVEMMRQPQCLCQSGHTPSFHGDDETTTMFMSIWPHFFLLWRWWDYHNVYVNMATLLPFVEMMRQPQCLCQSGHTPSFCGDDETTTMIMSIWPHSFLLWRWWDNHNVYVNLATLLPFVEMMRQPQCLCQSGHTPSFCGDDETTTMFMSIWPHSFPLWRWWDNHNVYVNLATLLPFVEMMRQPQCLCRSGHTSSFCGDDETTTMFMSIWPHSFLLWRWWDNHNVYVNLATLLPFVEMMRLPQWLCQYGHTPSFCGDDETTTMFMSIWPHSFLLWRWWDNHNVYVNMATLLPFVEMMRQPQCLCQSGHTPSFCGDDETTTMFMSIWPHSILLWRWWDNHNVYVNLATLLPFMEMMRQPQYLCQSSHTPSFCGDDETTTMFMSIWPHFFLLWRWWDYHNVYVNMATLLPFVEMMRQPQCLCQSGHTPSFCGDDETTTMIMSIWPHSFLLWRWWDNHNVYVNLATLLPFVEMMRQPQCLCQSGYTPSFCGDDETTTMFMSIWPHSFLLWRWWDNHNVYVNLATLLPFVEMMRQPQCLCRSGHTSSFCGDDETTTMFMSIWPHSFLLWRWWDNHNVYVNLATLLPFVEMMRLPQWLCQYGHTPSFCGDDETTTMFMSIWPHSFLLWRWWDNHNVYVNLATLLPFVEMMRLPQCLCQYGHTPSFCGDDETTTMFMSIWPHSFLLWRWWDNHNVYVDLATLLPFVEMMRLPQCLCQYGHTPSFCGDDETTTMFMSIWPHSFLLWRWWDYHNDYVNMATLLPFVEMMRQPQCLCQSGHTPSFCGDDETTTMFMSIWPHSFLLWRWWDNHNVCVNLATLLPFVEMMRQPQCLCQSGHTPSFCGDDETTTMFMSIWPHSFLSWRWWDNHNVYVNLATLLPFVEMMRQPQCLCQSGHTPFFCGDDETTTMFMSIWPRSFLLWRWWDNHNVYVDLATLLPFVEMMRIPQCLCQYGHTPFFCGDDETTTMFMSIWPHSFLLWRWWDNHNVYVNLATLLPFVEMMRLPQCLCQYGHTPSFCGDDETTTMFMSIWPHSFLLWRWWDYHNVYVNMATLLPFVEMMRQPQCLCRSGHTPSFCGYYWI